jgi:hypothetical protein
MKQSEQKSIRWTVKNPGTTAQASKHARPAEQSQPQMEIYRDLAMALIGARLDMRKAA